MIGLGIYRICILVVCDNVVALGATLIPCLDSSCFVASTSVVVFVLAPLLSVLVLCRF